jgi:hypothetical protein
VQALTDALLKVYSKVFFLCGKESAMMQR